MTQYTCISIGINSYYNFQPLSYAIADAQGLVQCLEDHDNLADEQSLLMTDNSPRLGNYSTYPNRENILNWLANGYSQTTATSLNPSSVLWFFFSGYGLHYQGEDYLIPIDGEPQDLVNTGISMRSLFTLLQQQGAGKIVVILDINRSPGMLGEIGVGEQTVDLAGKMGIACILSAEPHQVSHEAASLGHGIFTSALLEALKYYRRDLTLHNLKEYLKERLPELSEHHWRPVQNPILVLPILEAAQTPVLPALVSAGITWSNLSQLPLENSTNYLNGSSVTELSSVAVATNGTAHTTYTEVQNTLLLEENNASNNGNSASILTELTINNDLPLQELENGIDQPDIPRAKRQFSVKNLTNQPWHNLLNKQILTKGMGGIIIFILALFGLNQAINQFKTSNPVISDTPTDSQNNPEIPTPETTIEANLPQGDSVGKEYLKEAKAVFQNDQASNFSRAIDQVRKVPENDPYYAQAQAAIYRWSQNIWDIAQSRADQGNFTSAIAAAKLIATDQTQLYTEAQNSIKEWEQKITKQTNNNQLLEKAKSLINSRQASSYIKAMQIIEKIGTGETGDQEARKLREQWSRQVYLIANSRASRGQFQLAIKTALLVPEDTPSYQNAQKAIARWKQGKK